MPPKFQLLKEKTLWQRFDTIIFSILYPLTLLPFIQLLNANWISEAPEEASNGTFAFIVDHLDVPNLEPHTLLVMSPFIIAGIHLLIFLFSTWSISFNSWLKYSTASEKDATHVLFTPSQHRGSAQIVKFDKSSNPPFAIFQQKKREFVNGQFVSLKYPTDLTVQEYLDSKGISRTEKTEKLNYFGLNSYQIPVPSFKELMKEHVLAPFFVFQVFSICCWMLDEYFIYPLFSLVSLFILEANTVNTRQSNLLELRGVENESTRVQVYRDGSWTFLESGNLLPGDIVLINQEIICPADLLLLSGRCVTNEAMLTGESTPQVKDNILSLPKDYQIDPSKDKRFIIFGGTKIEQIIPGESHIYLPTKGCLAYVISTGLGSSQGRLIRTILFASQRVSAESKDSMYLLVFLSIFAIFASGYVVYYGRKSSTISTFRIIVECLLILTSSIPPDLPMQLTVSVNASLLALSKLAVFCTEPFRIPFAGTVSVCCFDKTGTLTAEEYKLAGVDEMTTKIDNNNHNSTETSGKLVGGVVGNLENDSNNLSNETLMVIGSCHSLINGVNGKLIGDTLEATAFSQMGFSITPGGKNKHKKFTITTQKLFHFSAEMRRMTAIAGITNNKLFVLTKGAPEVIAEHLATVPEDYFTVYRNYTRQGCRVLALASRPLEQNEMNLNNLTREQAESNLIFRGFTVFSAPMKRGTEDTIVELLKSTHRVIIITGDDPLTACHVASRLHIMNKPPLIHDDGVVDSFGEPAQDSVEYSHCYTGKALSKLSSKEFSDVVRHCNVFARMSPQSKEDVLYKLKELGERTLMCGDGTNDVGALKQAHVGVGLVENSLDIAIDDDEYKPKLGAASIAAPFVSKRSTISACIDLIRFGRATLSSTIDLFKQLSLNCLISAYSVSVLFIENVKFGDQQLTIFALGISFAFMSISWAKPLRKLSKERPFESQFNLYLVTSVLLQFAVHFYIIYLVRNLVFSTGYVTKPFNYKLKFEPGLMNTAMYIITSEMQIATFISNYRGRPFMQAFHENKLLLISILISLVFVVLMLCDSSDLLRSTFQIVQFPSTDFRDKMALYCAIDIALSYIVEKICLFIFTMKSKLTSNNLVDPTILKELDSYVPHNDDVLPEEKHSFGIKDMFKQNMELQKKMMIKRNEITMKEQMKLKKNSKKSTTVKTSKK
ncbi:E1-E2 ATPase family protein [Tritrichomonas foetus]|uniref:E1-E2 ATPase family protein n=1 Tax=Tritrichomonas foetus TaxID=1144522 RepID=A0A1J4KV18_9EUKA|nr:E1-E2 ATPase family protein [Tritrichomonas foetus]|eukprot:OHT14736.1 E1-E2 ATPase family protein [Tritrichomonas foetus]